MHPNPVIAIFDVGKTNKKLLLFDQQYNVVFERSAKLDETIDEDGDPCENLERLSEEVIQSLRELFDNGDFDVRCINFSTYGASFVYINADGVPIAPLYSYLKPFPSYLKHHFYQEYGGEMIFSLQTASPVLGSLNSGMQLFRLKYEQPAVFDSMKYALHLPQYMSYLLTKVPLSDITSIGCHTNMWDFKSSEYHSWLYREGITEKLAPIAPSDEVRSVDIFERRCLVGIGLHDSSAALIPYLLHFHEPFVLISTGTWCISLNPFTTEPLTADELAEDCLCYLSYNGTAVKASRVFAGQEHDEQVARISSHFDKSPEYYQMIQFHPELLSQIFKETSFSNKDNSVIKSSAFRERDLSSFRTGEEAYHQLVWDLVQLQVYSTGLVLKKSSAKRIFVDGGFSRNSIYMNMLATASPGMEVFAASMAQATALGAALAVHKQWNDCPIPQNLIDLKHYASHAHL